MQEFEAFYTLVTNCRTQFNNSNLPKRTQHRNTPPTIQPEIGQYHHNIKITIHLRTVHYNLPLHDALTISKHFRPWSPTVEPNSTIQIYLQELITGIPLPPFKLKSDDTIIRSRQLSI